MALRSPLARRLTLEALPRLELVRALPSRHTADPELHAYLLAKRIFDTAAALVLLSVLLPLMIVLAVAVKLDTRGPVFYRQRRVGKYGREFCMLKFCTMKANRRMSARDRRAAARQDTGSDRRVTLKSARDPRVTRLGRFLRKMSLDEIPQLLNIVRGEMSFVGPRPEVLEMLAHYGPEHYHRHLATPGLTGWWQINGRIRRQPGITPAEDLKSKLADDVYYLEHRSLFMDLRILLMTVPVALFGRGAY